MLFLTDVVSYLDSFQVSHWQNSLSSLCTKLLFFFLWENFNNNTQISIFTSSFQTYRTFKQPYFKHLNSLYNIISNILNVFKLSKTFKIFNQAYFWYFYYFFWLFQTLFQNYKIIDKSFKHIKHFVNVTSDI